MRYVFNRFAEALEIIVRPGRYVRLDGETHRALKELLDEIGEKGWKHMTPYADGPHEVRSIAEDMIRFGIRHRWTTVEMMETWEKLTPREQEVTAYVSLGYTNDEIAERMVISKSTVKTHIRALMTKFGLNGKLELKGAMSDWDFSTWEDGWD